MLNINLICVGGLKEEYFRAASKEYEKRLSSMCRLTVTEITPAALPKEPSDAQIAAALEKEAELITKKLTVGAVRYAMCIEGTQRSSERLSAELSDHALAGRSSFDFIIGSSYGLAPSVKQAADCRLSMSEMTFPHRLARIMLLEQIYRALSITAGSKYHK